MALTSPTVQLQWTINALLLNPCCQRTVLRLFVRKAKRLLFLRNRAFEANNVAALLSCHITAGQYSWSMNTERLVFATKLLFQLKICLRSNHPWLPLFCICICSGAVWALVPPQQCSAANASSQDNDKGLTFSLKPGILWTHLLEGLGGFYLTAGHLFIVTHCCSWCEDTMFCPLKKLLLYFLGPYRPVQLHSPAGRGFI